MTSNSIEERRQYVDKVKASFREQEQGVRQEPDAEETTFNYGFFKLKLILAAAILVAFIYCDQNHISVYGKKTEDVYQQLEETIDIKRLMEHIDNIAK